MDKMFALKNNFKEFDLFEQEHRYLPGNHSTDFPEEDSTRCAITTYFRTIGLHALLSRQDEVNIAKRIEAGEHEILRALLQTSIAVQHIADLGKKINSGEIRAKRVSRAIRSGTTFTDEAARIQELLATITLIEVIDAKNTVHRAKLLSLSSTSGESRHIYRQLVRGADQIYYLLRHWRLESEIIDVIEETIRQPENVPETDALLIRSILDGINKSRARVQAAKNELIKANLRSSRQSCPQIQQKPSAPAGSDPGRKHRLD